MSVGIQPLSGHSGFPEPLVRLGERVREPGFGVPTSAALQFGSALYAYATIDGEPTGQLLQIWGVSAVLLLSLTFVWPASGSRGWALLAANLLAQYGAFALALLLADQALGTGTRVFAVNLGQALIVAWALRRYGPRTSWAPRSAADLGVFLLASLCACLASTPLGAWPGIALAETLTPEAALWVVRGFADLAMGAMPAMLICHSRAGGHLRLHAPWVQTLLLPALVLANWLMFRFSTLPLAWLVVLCAVWAGLALTPRLAGLLALLGSGITVLVGNLLGRPWHGTGTTGSAVVVDLLSLICVYLVVLLALVRAQRATMQRRVDAQRSLLNAVFRAMADGVVVFHPDGRVIFANRRAIQLLGRPSSGEERSDWGTYFARLTPVDGADFPADVVAARHRLDAAGGSEIEAAITADEQEAERFLRINLRRFGPEDARLVAVISDVTEHRIRQRELKKFAGRVAHDLRNPMTSAQLWLETVQDALIADDAAAAHRCADRADQALRRLNQVVDGWLLYSIAHDSAPDPVTCHLDRLAAELTADLSPMQADLAPEFLIDAPDPVFADETLVRQVLANLLGNALKYGVNHQRPRIELRTRPLDQLVEVEVRDHGPGITPGEEERIFEEFHRGAEVSEEVRGSGIGLATCRTIVERHGGTIRAESPTGGPGTRIVFTLPAAPGVNAGAPSAPV